MNHGKLRQQIKLGLVTGFLALFGWNWMPDQTLAAQEEPPTEEAQAADDEIPPTDRDELLKWLKAGKYKAKFVSEKKVHPSDGPHGGNVLTYYNPILVEDLKDKKTLFRTGASMVKELYLSGTEKAVGYSVMIKTKEKGTKAKGKFWLFYETFDGTNQNPFYGKGVPLCVNCHTIGVDFLRSTFRPEN
ncbi:MAG: hypothetical protein K1Y36_18035 [Blastocatellia bacterium]|nr:hypothetical protein [Blastocatellia bacterium]